MLDSGVSVVSTSVVVLPVLVGCAVGAGEVEKGIEVRRFHGDFDPIPLTDLEDVLVVERPVRVVPKVGGREGSREALLRIPWAPLVSLELSWALLRLSEDCLGPPWVSLEAPWNSLGIASGSLGALWPNSFTNLLKGM